MGFTRGLVRSVFSRNCSDGSHESKVKRNAAENRRWVSVRTCLCSDEFNSVLVEEDSASVKSSQFNVTQPIQEGLIYKEETRSEETVENRPKPNSRLLNEDEAAILIQSAYRGFLLRHQNEEIGSKNGREEINLVTESSDRNSLSTSVEVQAGNSTEVFSVQGEKLSINKQRTRIPVMKQKDWDDSTVSSNVSKMRMQNRMEATTRRERALAYAFSQQLRICSKRKSPKYNSMEPNMSWNWLERWMATRIQDTSSIESHSMKQYDPFNSNHKFAIKTRILDAAKEEKESCGSNEVPLHLDNYSLSSLEEKFSFKAQKAKTKLKARRNVSMQKTVDKL